MDDEVTFYTNPMSRGQIVRWMLEEVGRPYKTEIVDYATSLKSPAYLSINPMGKVPAVRHRGEVVTECAAICAYLADAFPEAGLAPKSDSPARGPYLRWLFFAAGPIEAAVSDKALGVVVPPERTRMIGYGTFEQTLDVLEGAVRGRTHLAGEGFSAADLYLGAQLIWGLQFGSIEKRPAFEAFVANLVSRPAYKKARSIDADLIARAAAS